MRWKGRRSKGKSEELLRREMDLDRMTAKVHAQAARTDQAYGDVLAQRAQRRHLVNRHLFSSSSGSPVEQTAAAVG